MEHGTYNGVVVLEQGIQVVALGLGTLMRMSTRFR
jgi:hypothetical protein